MYPFLHSKWMLVIPICVISAGIFATSFFTQDQGVASAGQASVLGASLSSELEQKYGEYTEATSLDHLKLNRANIIWFTNYYRVRVDLPVLATQASLNNSAYGKGRDMLAFHYFDHTRGSGKNTIGFDRFLDNEHYEFIKSGENLALGDFTTSKEVVDAWMKSPNHKKNILDATYTEIGVSVVSGEYQGKSTTFIIQHFGKPRKSCPIVDRGLKNRIEALKEDMEIMLENITPETTNHYNESVVQLNEWVGTYNQQVKAFESCAI